MACKPWLATPFVFSACPEKNSTLCKSGDAGAWSMASSTWGAIHKINASKPAGSALSNCGYHFLSS
eukprot:1426277-Karenia_brevis.AAC.1